MNTRVTLILAVVLLLIGGFYYIYEVKMAAKKEEKKKTEGKLLSFEGKDVTALELVKDKEVLRFEKQGGRWMMTSPERTLASQSILENMITLLSDMKKDETIEENPQDLTMFGLKPPQVTVKVMTAGAKGSPGEQSILIGSKNPSGNLYYVQLPGKPAVITINSTLSSNLEKSALEFREKDALPLEPEKVSKVTVQLPDKTFTLENPQNFWTAIRKDPSWKLTAPMTAKADRAKVSSFLWDVKNLKAETFAGGKTKVAVSPEDTAYTMKITIDQKDMPQETLLIGTLDKKAKIFAAMRLAGGEKFTVKEDDVKKLFKSGEDFMDRHLLAVDPQDIDSFELKTATTTVKAKRNKEGWEITAPPKVKKEVPSIDSLIWKFESALYTEKGESGSGREPALTVTLTGSDKAQIATLVFEKSPEEKKYFVQVTPGEGGYYVVNDDIPELAKTVMADIEAAVAKAPGTTPSLPAASPSPVAPGLQSPVAPLPSPSLFPAPPALPKATAPAPSSTP
ncbi:MAG: DUF4340 domain-containing protein [Candidatus Eremiobacteraeota bacterium]|nr:DUF4340 domain-containing protein [Candidatus Eremiobacteraeota bacterium]